MTDLATIKRAAEWLHETDEQDLNCDGLDDNLPVVLCYALDECDMYDSANPDGFGYSGQDPTFIGAIVNDAVALSVDEFNAAYPAANLDAYDEAVFEEVNKHAREYCED